MVLPKTAVTDDLIAIDYTEISTVGYPRSGNTWTGRLLADLLDSPWQEVIGNPIRFYGPREDGKFVIRKSHYCGKMPGLSVYIYRDPRDICVSRYFYWQRASISHEIRFMAGTAVPEQDHPRQYEKYARAMWGHPENYTVAVTYEDLHERPVETLRSLVLVLTGIRLAYDRIQETIDRQSVRAILARFPDYAHSVRKGIVGDWRNHFTRDDGRLFQEYFGRLMLDQGYITDGDWWEELPA